MKLSTPSVGSLLLGLAGLVSVAQAGGQHLARAGAGSDPSKHAQVARKLWKRFSGRATFYDPNTGNQGACGGFIGTNDWVVAINTDQYAGGSHCGQQVTISANGVTQTATIRDACPGCGYGGLDMTPGLFSAFADHSVGVLQITWNFGGSSGGGGGNNNNNNNDRTTSTSSRWTSQYTPPSTTSHRWTPTSTSSWRRTSTSSQWTPSSSHRESSSTWSPPPSSSSSSSRSSSSSSWSSSSSEWSSSSVHPSNATIAINVLAPNATATESSGSTAPEATTSNTPLLSPSSNNTSTSETHGALANMAQVVLRMATVVVAAADTA